ncbi:MAG: hypothetical protein V3T83_17240 [Acidobacteriota bacterium]
MKKAVQGGQWFTTDEISGIGSLIVADIRAATEVSSIASRILADVRAELTNGYGCEDFDAAVSRRLRDTGLREPQRELLGDAIKMQADSGHSQWAVG